MTDSESPAEGPADDPPGTLAQSVLRSLAMPVPGLQALSGTVTEELISPDDDAPPRRMRGAGRRGMTGSPTSPATGAGSGSGSASGSIGSHRAAGRRRRGGWPTMVGLAAALVFTATTVAAIVIITATPQRRDPVGPPAAVPGPGDPTANAEGCLAYDQALRRLDEIISSDAIPHPEIAGVVATARGRVAAAAENTWGPAQQAMDRVVTRLQIWSDHEGDHQRGGRLDDRAEIDGLRRAAAVVGTRCAEAGVDLRNRLTG